MFWVKKQDKKGRPYAFGIKVKNDVFDLSVFTKSTKGKEGKVLEPGTQSDDASSRDFTINSMYLGLANDNGPNKDLYDYYGGMHHLLSGKVSAVGDLESKIKEDPVRALRYVRMLTRYGDPRKVPEEDKQVVRNSAEHLKKLDPKDITDEFMKGLNYDDTDARKYLRTYAKLGLLGNVFPGLSPDTQLPKQLRELGDKHAPIAWMLRSHNPKDIEGSLGGTWKPEDLKKVVFLIKSLGMGDTMDPDGLEDLTRSYMSSGVSSRKLKQWATKLGNKPESTVDAFLKHASSPRVQVYQNNSDGSEGVTEQFQDLKDPFTGTLNLEAVGYRKKQLELLNFKRLLADFSPKNV